MAGLVGQAVESYRGLESAIFATPDQCGDDRRLDEIRFGLLPPCTHPAVLTHGTYPYVVPGPNYGSL